VRQRVEYLLPVKRRLLSLLLLVLAVPACGSVPYWEKGNLADPVMAYQPDGTLTHFEHKVFQSIEGAAGGFGASAGGGCGCN